MWLPDPTEFGLPAFPDAFVAIRVPRDGLRLFRLVRNRPATPDDFKRHTLAWAIAGNHPEVMRFALSHYLTFDAAGRVLTKPGSRIAELVLEPNPFVMVARTNRLAGGFHVSVWGPYDILLRAIVGYSEPMRVGV